MGQKARNKEGQDIKEKPLLPSGSLRKKRSLTQRKKEKKECTDRLSRKVRKGRPLRIRERSNPYGEMDGEPEGESSIRLAILVVRKKSILDCEVTLTSQKRKRTYGIRKHSKKKQKFLKFVLWMKLLEARKRHIIEKYCEHQRWPEAANE